MDLTIVITFVIGWFIGSMYANYQHISHMRKLAKERGIDFDKMVKSMVEMQKPTVPIFTAEKQNEVIYLYERNSKAFIAQGTSYEELAKITLETHKIPAALVVEGDNEIWFLQGQVKNR